MDGLEEAALTAALSISCVAGVVLVGVEVPDTDGDGGSRSIDCGLPRLFFFIHPDFTVA